MDATDVRAVAVVVTWNRRDLLVECLDALRAQTHHLAAIVVIDNASTDGTDELLARYTDLDMVRLAQNIGGAGGFTAGIERALLHSPDCVWLLDDDTVPTPTALDELVKAWVDYPGERPAVVASRVEWTDGREHPMNTPRVRPAATKSMLEAAAAVAAIPVRSASFVSILCDAQAIRDYGFPVADYFLWNDDFEYSTRLIRHRPGIHVPASVVIHKTKSFGSTDVDPGERFYFEVRNKVWLFGRSLGLRPHEKAMYAGATARRWVRTYKSSRDKATLRRAAGKGLRDGLLKAPRPNSAVVGEASPPQPVPDEAFSLLMSTWAGDDPQQLVEAFESSVTAQTRRPTEVVIVQDGPLSNEAADSLAGLIDSSPVPARVVKLEKNRGLGPALDAGLAACSHEVVARMDADDVSAPNRFELQLPLIEKGADIVGAGLWEFGSSIDDIVGQRTPPVDPEEIRRAILFRDPFNHPTVVYRKSAVLAAGGYADVPLLEDYLLFTRMVMRGAVPANLPDPLVYYRVGEGAYARRGGRNLLRSELILQRRLRMLGLTTRGEYIRNVAIRGGYRLVPEDVRKHAYRRLLANRSSAARR